MAGAGSQPSQTATRALPSRFADLVLPIQFYDRPTENVALDLLGAVIYNANGSERAGRIVEVEAYLGRRDPACHIGNGLTPRTRGIFGRPGTAYVFIVYGLHLCLNAITMKRPPFGCVLIRAVEPWNLVKEKRKERSNVIPSGPGLVSRYLRLNISNNGTSLADGPVVVLDLDLEPDEIGCTPRIGVSGWEKKLLRFYDVESECVSAM